MVVDRQGASDLSPTNKASAAKITTYFQNYQIYFLTLFIKIIECVLSIVVFLETNSQFPPLC